MMNHHAATPNNNSNSSISFSVEDVKADAERGLWGSDPGNAPFVGGGGECVPSILLGGGRTTATSSTAPPPPVLKDLNFLKKGRKLGLPSSTFSNIQRALETDCKLLESNQLMDYSMLIGVHLLPEYALAAGKNATTTMSPPPRDTSGGGDSLDAYRDTTREGNKPPPPSGGVVAQGLESLALNMDSAGDSASLGDSAPPDHPTIAELSSPSQLSDSSEDAEINASSRTTLLEDVAADNMMNRRSSPGDNKDISSDRRNWRRRRCHTDDDTEQRRNWRRRRCQTDDDTARKNEPAAA